MPSAFITYNRPYKNTFHYLRKLIITLPPEKRLACCRLSTKLNYFRSAKKNYFQFDENFELANFKNEEGMILQNVLFFVSFFQTSFEADAVLLICRHVPSVKKSSWPGRATEIKLSQAQMKKVQNCVPGIVMVWFCWSSVLLCNRNLLKSIVKFTLK